MTPDTIQYIPVSQIAPGKNDRTVFDPAELQELADSIRTHGLAQPITVRPLPPSPFLGERPGVSFQIVAGERRFRAISNLLHWETIPAIVRALTDQQASDIMLIENISRKDLDPVDEALAYQQRITENGDTPASLSHRCGVSAERIKKRLKLLAIREDILHLVRKGQFPVGHAEILGKLDRNRQIIAARPLIDGQKITFRDFQTLVDKLYTEQTQESLFSLAPLNLVPDIPTSIQIIEHAYPVAPDLPEPAVDAKATTGDVMLDYIRTLEGTGHKREAAVIGRLLQRLTASNYVRLNPVRLNI